jgi:nitroreductase
MNIIDKLYRRYATKQFSEQKLSDEKLHTILHALTLSPSSMGLQPWKFILVENQDLRQKLHQHSYKQNQIIEASHLLVLCRYDDINHVHVEEYAQSVAQQRNMPRENLDGYVKSSLGLLMKMTSEEKIHWMEKQLYLALGNLLTVCAVEEVDACPIEGIIVSEYDRELGLHQLGLKTVIACPIGYRNEDDKYAHLPKVRYSKEELIVVK